MRSARSQSVALRASVPVPMIGILFTGGTIAMRIDPASGAAVPALSAAEILAQVPNLAECR